MSEIEHVVDAVAADLAWISPEPVYVGGATIGLFLDALGRSQLRATLDVDCIVPRVVTRVAWWRLEEGLRARGWSPDPDGPICRYRSPGGVVVDLMSEDPGVLGFSGRWYPRVVERAERRTLVTGRSVLVAPPDWPKVVRPASGAQLRLEVRGGEVYGAGSDERHDDVDVVGRPGLVGGGIVVQVQRQHGGAEEERLWVEPREVVRDRVELGERRVSVDRLHHALA